MPKKQKRESKPIADLQPDELNELKKIVSEYIARKQEITNEISCLKEDLKTLDEEFADKLDVKTLKFVERVLQIEAAVECKDTFDMCYDILKDPTT